MNTSALLAASNVAIIGYGVGAFLFIIIGLVAFLAVSRKFLVAEGNVSISVNGGKKTFESGRGGTVLDALIGQGIILPSACGGGGSCAMCKCHVLSGGGDVLATEKGHLSRKEQQDHVRLACQVKVKEDMDVQVEDEVFGIKSWECTVRSNNNVATFIKEFVVDLPEGETLDFRAGGYIQIDVPKYHHKYSDFDIEEQYRGDWENFKLFDIESKVDEPLFRAYSMANHPAEGNMVMLNVRIATPPPRTEFPPGKCSSWIFGLKPGDKVRISGPFGEFFMKDTDREIMFIGGGAGMAPMRSHIFDLFHTKKSNRKATFWYGARSKREMFYDEHFKAIEQEFPNFKYYVGLSDAQPEDNWKLKKDINDEEGDGFEGFIHNVILENYLKNHDAPEDIEYYLCGPPMMNSAIKDMLDSLGVDPEMIALDEF